MSRAIATLSLVGMALAQGPPPGGNDDSNEGASSSSWCSTTDGSSCATDGSSNEHLLNLDYDSSTGKFSGSVTTNLCADFAYGITAEGDDDIVMAHSSSCIEQSIPASDDYANTFPNAAPLRDRIAIGRTGVNIYGPFDAGFTKGQICNAGTCDGGSDVPICEASLIYTCEAAGEEPAWWMLLDTCGGHAMPYHFHYDPACEYVMEETTHSPLVGFAFDGYGLYGLLDWDGDKPSLDACNGHTGLVPEDDELGVTSSSVYHYHTSTYAPYTIGCYGPVDSVSECRDLYSTCDESATKIQVSSTETIEYVLDCPCYSQYGDYTDAASTWIYDP